MTTLFDKWQPYLSDHLEPNDEWIILGNEYRRAINERSFHDVKNADPARHPSHVADELVPRANLFGHGLLRLAEARHRPIGAAKRLECFWGEEVGPIGHLCSANLLRSRRAAAAS